jgi:hypothetical protein
MRQHQGGNQPLFCEIKVLAKEVFFSPLSKCISGGSKKPRNRALDAEKGRIK